MRVRFWILALALSVAASSAAFAQVQSGNISGVVRDEQGGVLPGVLVTLEGDGPTQTFTTEGDGQYRFLNVPPGSYKLTAALQGFRTHVREGVVVIIGQSVQLPLTLNVATVEESVTVSGESPIIDAKAMGTATNFTQDELAKIPNSRDPWALLRTVPGVTLDRVNIAGNETGQQSAFVSKGGRQGDAVWTMDGVPITDMATGGASPTYFDYDAFEEIQISTGGNDIRQPTGGVGLNFVVKRGTNQFRGTARGYYTEDGLEATNLPDELLARGFTRETADHNEQISDWGFDFGGPILREKLFFWGSYGVQDIRLFRQSARGTDRTILKTYNVKVNYQATEKDMFNFLLFNGDKVKNGRAPGNALIEPTSARYDQGNYYRDNPLHGLWKWEYNRVVSNNLFLTGRYAYYNTGFTLESIGPLTEQMGISALLGQTFGSTNALYFTRPQYTLNIDGSNFQVWGGKNHDLKFGFGWRMSQATSETIYPGNMIVAYENRTDLRARVYRTGLGTNQADYMNFYVGDTITLGRVTLDLGVRYDRQGGKALPSETLSNAVFADRVPGITFPGYEVPYTWSDVSPRVGMTYALDEARKTILRASFSRNAAQLTELNTFIGYANPSSGAGWIEVPWIDANGDHLAQTGEVQITGPVLASGNGFNTANPTAVTSANQIDPNFTSAKSNGVIIGVDRELMPNLALHVNYTYSRVTDHPATYFIGLTSADWTQTGTATGTTPDGVSFSIPLFSPDAAKVAAVGGGRILTNYDGYYTTFNGLEVAINKRMSNRWMARLAFAWNNPQEFYDMNPAVNSNGNPTRTDTGPLVDGGMWAPRSGGSGSGDVFVNQKWNFNLNGAYQLPWNMEVAGNLFGKQGTPYPYFITRSLGREGNQRILVNPELDSIRFEDLWNLDLRIAKNFNFAGNRSVQLVADLFNVANSNTEITRERNLESPNFRVLGSNLSPRILRFGARVGF